jgi:hypothetical protein
MTPRKKLEDNKQEEDSQTVSVDLKDKTIDFTNRGQSGLVLLKAIAFFVVLSSISVLVYCLAYLLDVVGKHFFDSVGMILWATLSFISARLLRWPHSH